MVFSEDCVCSGISPSTSGKMPHADLVLLKIAGWSFCNVVPAASTASKKRHGVWHWRIAGQVGSLLKHPHIQVKSVGHGWSCLWPPTSSSAFCMCGFVGNQGTPKIQWFVKQASSKTWENFWDFWDKPVYFWALAGAPLPLSIPLPRRLQDVAMPWKSWTDIAASVWKRRRTCTWRSIACRGREGQGYFTDYPPVS